jgi:hypothetical protein
MFLMLQPGVSFVFIGTMIFSLVIIIASIRWIKDLYKVKKGNGLKQ